MSVERRLQARSAPFASMPRARSARNALFVSVSAERPVSERAICELVARSRRCSRASRAERLTQVALLSPSARQHSEGRGDEEAT